MIKIFWGMIPTAITRYDVEGEGPPFTQRFRRSISVVGSEIVRSGDLHFLVIRWSPINIAFKRLLRRL